MGRKWVFENLKKCLNGVLGTFSHLYTSQTRLYRKKMSFSGKSHQLRLKTSISPTRTPNLIKIPGVEIPQKTAEHEIFRHFF